MSSRRSVVAMSLWVSISIVGALACNQRGSKQQPTPAQAGSGSGPGTGAISAGSGAGAGSVAAAIKQAMSAPPDPSLSDGTLKLVGIDVLTTPPALFQQRAAGAGPKPMEPLKLAAADAVRSVDAAKPGVLGDNVVVWIAIRPGKKTRTWVACPRKPAGGADLDAARAEITGRLKLAAAPDVSGPVSFTVTFDRSGVRSSSHDIPLPPELERLRGATGDAPSPEELIARAWKP